MSQNSLKSSRTTFYVSRVAMLSAIAGMLMIFDFPIPIFPGFYKFDFSYFPVVISTFSMGPVAGAITAIIKNIIAFLIAGTFTDSAGIGALADLLIGLSFIVPAGLIYRKMHTKKGAIISMAVSLVVVSAFSCLFNYFFLIPAYSKFFGLEAVLKMAQAATESITDVKGIIVLGTLPFNFLKWLVISILTIVTYKPLSKTILKKPK